MVMNGVIPKRQAPQKLNEDVDMENTMCMCRQTPHRTGFTKRGSHGADFRAYLEVSM